ncbi:unnamed protein product [Echinostoma caproni]|uniref:Transmembrane protein 163 n=1 Tax=Echinostoma caproni TaxID=27848 RepID=A0A183APN7_9TREM|nr:unnamed protein product [Echinostoma caproni]
MQNTRENVACIQDSVVDRGVGDDDTELTQRLYVSHASGQDAVYCAEEGGVTANHSVDSGTTWRTHPIELFLPHLSENVVEMKKLPKNVKIFYQKQDALIQELIKLNTLEADDPAESGSNGKGGTPSVSNRKLNAIILRLVLLVNLFLLVGKAVASIVSGSLSIISSLLDSCVDIASGGIMWFTSRQMRKRRPYTYPQGALHYNGYNNFYYVFAR